VPCREARRTWGSTLVARGKVGASTTRVAWWHVGRVRAWLRAAHATCEVAYPEAEAVGVWGGG
jgi:hypothetical protein